LEIPLLKFVFDVDIQYARASDLIEIVTEALSEKMKSDKQYLCEFAP